MAKTLPGRVVDPRGCVIVDDYLSFELVEVGRDDNGKPIYEEGVHCIWCRKGYTRDEVKPFVSAAEAFRIVSWN